MNEQSQSADEVQFKFADDEMVKLKGDPSLLSDNLQEGAVGQVCCLYYSNPPGYEVLFTGTDGKEFSVIVFEPELEKMEANKPV